MTLPRGIRNNNPGNIRLSSTVWRGARAVQTDGSFVQFDDMPHGIRALGIELRNYNKIHGLKTIDGVIGRWAPTIENDTNSYAAFVAKLTKFGREQILTFDIPTVMDLAWAISAEENGGFWLTLPDLRTGIGMSFNA